MRSVERRALKAFDQSASSWLDCEKAAATKKSLGSTD